MLALDRTWVWRAGAVGCAAAIVAICTGVPLAEWIDKFGDNIPTDHIVQDYLKGLLWAVALGSSIPFWPVRSEDKRHLLIGWVIKGTICLTALLPYEHLYSTLDGYGYFRESEFFTLEPGSLSLGLGYSVMYALGRMHRIVGPASYHAMKVSFSFIGLIALYIFFIAACEAFGKRSISYFYTLLAIPSILLWSSILGKEPVILLGVAIYALGVVRLARYSGVKHGLLIAIGIAIVAIIRIWMGTLLVISTLFVLLVQSKVTFKWLVGACVITGAAIILGVTTEYKLMLPESESPIDVYANIDRSWGRANSRLDFDVDFTDLKSILAFVPVGCLVALYSPMPWQAHNLPSALASIESCFAALLTVMMVLKLRREHWRDKIFVWSAMLVVMWSLVYSLIAFRDLGSAVRYRLQIMPIMVGTFYLVVRGGSHLSDGRRKLG